MLQLKSLEQQHNQIGSGDQHAALSTLREKEAAVQANGMQLFGRRLQLLQEDKTMEVISYRYSALCGVITVCSWCGLYDSCMLHGTYTSIWGNMYASGLSP